MGSEWKTKDLKDCATWYSGGTPRKGNPDYWNGSIPWISAKSLKEFFIADSEEKVTEAGLKNGTRLVPKDSILFIVRGMSLKSEFRMGIATRPVSFNQDLKALVANGGTLPYFLAYAIKGKTAEILDLVGEAGHGTGVLPTDRIQAVQIPDLRLNEQQRIVDVLKTLDDKIELNRKMNATLEAMAQALFKSWFVDFDPVIDNALRAGNPIPPALQAKAELRRLNAEKQDSETHHSSLKTHNLRSAHHLFPAAFQETEELGWIPEGWEVSTIDDATTAIIDHRGKTPKKLGSDWVESGFPAVSAKNIKDGKLVRKDTIRFTDSDLYKKWMAQELNKGDVLMTSEAPLGEKMYLAKEFKWVLSQRLFALRANENLSGIYLYHWLNTAIAKADIDGRASGTTVQGIRQSELRKVKVMAPSTPSIAAFSKAADSLMEKRAINEENVEQLTKLRDTLLPKLISGELRVSEAEQLTEEALA
ncbi:MAG: restriction endonuclease subunit S [Opitutaceae bacterium]